MTLTNAVQFSGDPDRVLKKMTKLEDACFQRYIDQVTEPCLTKRLFARNLKGLSERM
ncbi:hypothetical protein KIL84_016572, partial [Mauremys mutica]